MLIDPRQDPSDLLSIVLSSQLFRFPIRIARYLSYAFFQEELFFPMRFGRRQKSFWMASINRPSSGFHEVSLSLWDIP